MHLARAFTGSRSPTLLALLARYPEKIDQLDSYREAKLERFLDVVEAH